MTRNNRVTTDDEDAGLPSPFVMGDYVYHWTFWRGLLLDAVFTPRLAQFIVQKEDGGELVVKDTNYAYTDNAEIQAGHEVAIVGLGERARGNTYHFCGLVDFTSTTPRHLSCWLNHIEWGTAHRHFGWRTRREAKDCIRAYYTAVFEALSRVCYGPLGTVFEEQVVPAAENAVKKWKFSF